MASVDIARWNQLNDHHHTSLANITVKSAIDNRPLRNTKAGWIIWDGKKISTVASKDVRGKHRNSIVAVLSKGTDKQNVYAKHRRAADANNLILDSNIVEPGYVVCTYVGFQSRFHTYFSLDEFYNS